MDKRKPSIPEMLQWRKSDHKIAMITVYDYPMASLVERSKAEMILVGDSLGMVILGNEGTINVTLGQIVYHLKAVRRAAPNTFVVGDMPYMTYQVSAEKAIVNAGRIMQAGADCVKMEGGVDIAPTIERVVKAGIPVMGHIGLTPQSAAALGGFKVQGKNAEAAGRILRDAEAVEAAGAFSCVVELVPAQINRMIYERTQMQIISTGSGASADGFNLNAYDLTGMFDKFKPKFVKEYCHAGADILQAFNSFAEECNKKEYPKPENWFNVSEAEVGRIKENLGRAE